MANFINFVGQLLYTASPDGGVTPATGLLAWIPEITGMIIIDPLMVLPFVILVVGLAFGLLGRIFSLR
jgi:hypothetical protein